MADLQARIGPKVKKLYPNLTWKRPGADLQSPPKNATKWGETHQSDENEYDSDVPGHVEHASSQTRPSPNKSEPDHRSSPSRTKQSSGHLSLLSRLGLSSDVPKDSVSEGEEAVSIQQSLLPRVGMTEDTPRSCHNIGSTWRDTAHIVDSNGYHNIANKHAQRSSTEASLPSSSTGQGNVFIAENQPLDDRHNNSSDDNANSDQTDGLVLKPSTKEASSSESLHKTVLQDSSKPNHFPSNIETPHTRSKDNLAAEKNITLPNSDLPPFQEREFEEGELVDSKSLPSQQVRDLLLPLVLKNAAHRVKEGNDDLSRHIAHNVLSDEVCSSFMDQMKEVRTEMHAHKNQSSHKPGPQMQLTVETIDPRVAHASLPSKIGQAPPSCPRSMILPIKTRFNGEIATKSSFPNDLAQPMASPERGGFHDHDQGRRYSQHRDPRFDGHLSHSRSCSPSRHSQGQLYHRPSDSSRYMARSRSPVPLATSPRPRSPPPRRRRSPPVEVSQFAYFRDRALRESPEEISGRRSGSPPGTSSYDRMPERRRIPSHDFKRIEGNISPRWETAESPQSPVYFSSRRHFDRRGADKVMSPRQSSFTHGRGLEFSRYQRDSYVGTSRSGSEFARRSVSPPRQRQHRQFSAERPLPRTPPPHSPQIATPNPYRQLPRSQASFEQRHREQGAYHVESLSAGAVSTSSHRINNATGSHHQVVKMMVNDNQDMYERVNDEVRMESPKISDDMRKFGPPNVLPCHNVPGVWFVKVALDDIGTLECSFDVDEATVLKWDLQHTNVNLPKRVHIVGKERLHLQICCFLQKHVQSVMETLKPDATAQDVATAMLAIENDWPTPGHLLIMVNPHDKNKRVWLPDKLESPCLPIFIEDCIFEGQNIVQFIQLSGMSERMFVLFATTRPLVSELQCDGHKEFVPAPFQNTIDGGKGDIFEIGFGKVTISDLS